LPTSIRYPVVRPDAAFLAIYEASLSQNPQVVADCGLMLIELRRDIADTERLSLLREQVEHTQPGRIGQRFQLLGNISCAIRW
jgi:hypothetical protein